MKDSMERKISMAKVKKLSVEELDAVIEANNALLQDKLDREAYDFKLDSQLKGYVRIKHKQTNEYLHIKLRGLPAKYKTSWDCIASAKKSFAMHTGIGITFDTQSIFEIVEA